MKKKVFLGIMAAVAVGGCTQQDMVQQAAVEGLTFAPSVVASEWNNDATRAAVQPMEGAGRQLYLHTMTAPTGTPVTRGAKYTNETFQAGESFHVSGYRYGEDQTVGSVTEPNFFDNATVSRNSGGEWRPTGQQYYVPQATDKIDFFAWFTPAGTSGVTVGEVAGGLKLQYTVPANPDEQPDLLTAVTRNQTYSSAANTAVPLAFQHELTAVNFVLDDNVAPGTITEIALLNVYTSGTLTVGGSWSLTTAPTETVYAQNFSTTSGDAVRSGDAVIENLMMIPQTFTSEDQQIRITMTVDNQERILYADLKPAQEGDPDRWTAGTTVTYKISTSSVNVLRIASVNYPTSWSAATGVKSAYAENDAIGVFSVNAAGKVLYANKKFTLNGSSQWVCADAAATLYEPGCTYYAYYPWQETLAAAPAANATVLVEDALPTADEFFADAVTAWTPATDQSTAAKLNAADLQIGRSTAGAASTVAFSLAHAMGLASVTMASKMVPKVLYLNANGTENYRTTETQSVVTSNNFTGNLPCAISNKHYFVVKPSTDVTFSAASTSALDAWSGNITANVAAADYTNYNATSPIITRNYVYRGWLYAYTGDVQTFTAPTTGTYTMECWGAQGGDDVNGKGFGGKGGYVIGTKSLTQSQNLYIACGQSGSGTPKETDVNWGSTFNGGGGISTKGEGSSGGGATHIATGSSNRGELKNYSSYTSEVLLVAGGGGGGTSWHYESSYGWQPSHGGYGGGLTGASTSGHSGSELNSKTAGGGTQSGPGGGSISGNTVGGFGYGGKGQGGTHGGSGGGAGWYGGTGGYDITGGGGGSSYYGGVDNGSTIDGNTNQTQPDGTTTKGHSGNGYARITSQVIE